MSSGTTVTLNGLAATPANKVSIRESYVLWLVKTQLEELGTDFSLVIFSANK